MNLADKIVINYIHLIWKNSGNTPNIATLAKNGRKRECSSKIRPKSGLRSVTILYIVCWCRTNCSCLCRRRWSRRWWLEALAAWWAEQVSPEGNNNSVITINHPKFFCWKCLSHDGRWALHVVVICIRVCY